MKKILIILLAIGILYIGVLQYQISTQGKSTAPANADYVIILGANVRGDVPSLALKARIDTAAEYLKANPNTVAIASGGKGPGEDISEAEAIRVGLMSHGINESRIILEERSTSTYENLRFSKKLIPAGLKKGVVVTNNFHLYRSVGIAKHNGLHLYKLAAKTPKSAIFKSYTREYLAITKYYLVSLF